MKSFFFSSLLLVFLSIKFASPTNLCSTAGLCCKHRDSECVAQKVFPNHTVDTSQLPCYCDHACLRLDDCCPDYKHFCSVHDCKVSEWGPWSPCSVRCGSGGFTERHRVVLHQASNGGLACPHLIQAKPCRGSSCDEDEPEENWTEGLFHSSTNSPSTTVAKTSSTTSEADNGTEGRRVAAAATDGAEDEKQIFHTLVQSTSHEKSQLSCMEMVIIRATKGCQHHDSRLHIGTRICVNCPKYNTNSIHHLPDPEEADENSIQETNCAELTQTPIRKFRLSSHCHGKLTFLAPNPTSTCSCSHGLHFRLIPEN